MTIGIGAATLGAAGIQAGGSALANYMGQKSANKQMKFQKKVLRHQYQWAMADMKAAGLNPILAYKQGGTGGAGGASYRPESLTEGFTRDAVSGINSAVGAKRAGTEATRVGALVKQITATTHNVNEDTKVKQAQARNLNAQTMATQATIPVHTAKQLHLTSQTQLNELQQLIASQTQKIIKSKVPGAQASAAMDKTLVGKILLWISKAKDAINPLTSSARDIRGMTR